MHDIFLSYAKKDKHHAQTIANALEKEGFDVWWDIDIPTGKTFDSVIEKAIDDTKCVIVLWSKHSITSEWVHTEAAEGKERNILVPVRIEDVEIPLAFKRRQTANLINWNKKQTDPLFKSLVEDIRLVILEAKEKKRQKEEVDAQQQKGSLIEEPIKINEDLQPKKTKYKFLLLMVGGLAILIIFIWIIVNSGGNNGEIRAWNDTTANNTIESYQNYQAKYPQGSYYDEASKLINVLKPQPSYTINKPRNGEELNLKLIDDCCYWVDISGDVEGASNQKIFGKYFHEGDWYYEDIENPVKVDIDGSWTVSFPHGDKDTPANKIESFKFGLFKVDNRKSINEYEKITEISFKVSAID